MSQLQCELDDAETRRNEQESKIATLDHRCLTLQKEITTVQNQADKLRTELASKTTKLKQVSFILANAMKHVCRIRHALSYACPFNEERTSPDVAQAKLISDKLIC